MLRAKWELLRTQSGEHPLSYSFGGMRICLGLCIFMPCSGVLVLEPRKAADRGDAAITGLHWINYDTGDAHKIFESTDLQTLAPGARDVLSDTQHKR
jgi:hypothetical protein